MGFSYDAIKYFCTYISYLDILPLEFKSVNKTCSGDVDALHRRTLVIS